MFRKKWFWFSILLVMGGVWIFFGRQEDILYETEEVHRGDIVEMINVSGTLEADNSIEVSFELTGKIRTLYAEVGEHIEKGDILAKMDDVVLQSQRQEAILGVETAVQAEWLARRNWNDLKPEEREIKKLASESARASLTTLEKNIERTVLRAPVAGVVTKIYKEAGEIVTTGSPVLQVATGDTTAYIEVDVPESDVAKLSIGQEAMITFDALTKNDVFRATVESLDPRSTVISDVVYYHTKFLLIDRDDRLKTGMSADADVITDRSENAILVSRRAIQEDDDGVYVEVKNDTTVSRRTVKTGLENDEGDVEILEGLSEGEFVVVGTGA